MCVYVCERESLKERDKMREYMCECDVGNAKVRVGESVCICV